MRTLALILAFAFSAGAQTLVGGLQGVPPQPSIPTSGNLIQCGAFNCSGDTVGSFPGDGFWQSATSCSPIINGTHQPEAGSNSLDIPAGCGTASQNGVPLAQNFLYPGGRVLVTSLQMVTGPTFQGAFDNPFRSQTWGNVFMGASTAISAPFDNGQGPGVGTNSGAFFSVYHSTYVNPFLFAGSNMTFDFRTPAYGTAGTVGDAYVSDVSVNAADYFDNYVRSPWSPKGYLYDSPSVLDCGGPQYPTLIPTWPAPFAGEVCGIVEIIQPWDSGTNAPVPLGNIVASVTEGTSAGCPGGSPVQTIVSGFLAPFSNVNAAALGTTKAMWYYDASSLTQESTPTTAHRICTAFTVTYSSGTVTYPWPDYVFYRVSDAFRNTLTNYLDADQGWWSNGSLKMPWGWYYSATATNSVGNQTPNWSITSHCTQHTNPVTCFQLSWNDNGNFGNLPVSDSTAGHAGQLITRNLMPLVSSFSNMHTTWSLDVQEQPTCNPNPGNADCLGAWLEAFADYTKGTMFVYQTNWALGTLLVGEGTDTTGDIPCPTGCTTPTRQLGTGNIKAPSSISPDLWFKWFAVGQNSPGQAGDTQVQGLSSNAVFVGTFGTGGYSVNALAPSCTAYSTRVLGWRPGFGWNNSTTVPPQADHFILQSEKAVSPFVLCGQIATMVGSNSTTEASPNANTGIMMPANNLTPPATPVCTSGCGTPIVFVVVYQAVCSAGETVECLTIPSSGTQAAASTSMNLPSSATCTANGWAGIYASLAGNSTSGKLYNYFLDSTANPVGFPLACGGTYTTPASLAAANQTMQIPTDTSANGLISWIGGSQTDVSALKVAAQTMCGADSANYPNAAKAAFGHQGGDEPGPDAVANFFYQLYGANGMLQWCPGMLVDNVATDATAVFRTRHFVDENVQDPYYNGSVPNADPTVFGGQNRNGGLYNSTYNACINNCQSSGTTAAAILDTHLTDVATWNWLFEGSYGLGLWNPTLTQFSIVAGSGMNTVNGFPYAEVKRNCLKAIIDGKAIGQKTPGCSFWSLESDNGMDKFTYGKANTQAYADHVRLSGELFDPAVNRTLMTKAVDSTMSTTQPGIFPPCSNCTVDGLGAFLTKIEYFSTTATNTPLTPAQICYNTPPSTVGNSYQNASLWPDGPLVAYTAKDPVYGAAAWQVGLNNGCGDAATTNNTGGLPYYARLTFDLTKLLDFPPGEGLTMQVVGNDYAGRSFYVFGANALCPTISFVAANQVCIPFSDQEAFLAWVRSPNCYTADGDMISSGDVKKVCQ